MLIVCTHLWRDVRIGEDWQVSVRLWRDSGTLNVLIVTEPNVRGRVAHSLQQLDARMLIEHSFTECAKLLPLITTILIGS